MNNLRAFTLVELILAMILSSIAVAFSLSVYTLTNQYFFKGKSVYSEMSDWINFECTLHRDFSFQESFQLDNDKVELYSANGKIIYEFATGSIIRRQGLQLDTMWSGDRVSMKYDYAKNANTEILLLDVSGSKDNENYTAVFPEINWPVNNL